jgi:hypothetical protein
MRLTFQTRTQRMNAYIYQAALWCAECGADMAHELERDGHKDSGDSDDFPQGPYMNGGGEADCPQHCECCGEHLENPLTQEGGEYVRKALADETGDRDVLRTWRDYYADAWGLVKA